MISLGLGSDHAGFELKRKIIEYLKDNKISYRDFGTYSFESVDYPIYAYKVCNAILNNDCEKGILVCGTGIGISIAANRNKGIRCALCNDVYTAELTRQHNDSNILALAGRFTDDILAIEILKKFLETEFSYGDNHVRRIEMIDKKEN